MCQVLVRLMGKEFLDECPYCGKLTNVKLKTCTNCGWIIKRKADK